METVIRQRVLASFERSGLFIGSGDRLDRQADRITELLFLFPVQQRPRILKVKGIKPFFKLAVYACE